MLARRMIQLGCAAAMVAGSMGGCKCDRGAGPSDGSQIESGKLVEQNPDVPRPRIVFPERWHSTNASVNAFVSETLQVCADGDYDGFRQLFGTSYAPPTQANFERIWRAVRNIVVKGLYRGSHDPPEYYLHAMVQYRSPDRKGHTQRDVVVTIFSEAGDWRLAPAPKEAVRKVRAASSRPAETQPTASQAADTGTLTNE